MMMIIEYWIGKNVEGCNRGLILGDIPAHLEGLKNMTTSVRIAGLRGDSLTRIRNRLLTNQSQLSILQRQNTN
jgi:hypothetical protein